MSILLLFLYNITLSLAVSMSLLSLHGFETTSLYSVQCRLQGFITVVRLPNVMMPGNTQHKCSCVGET